MDMKLYAAVFIVAYCMHTVAMSVEVNDTRTSSNVTTQRIEAIAQFAWNCGVHSFCCLAFNCCAITCTAASDEGERESTANLILANESYSLGLSFVRPGMKLCQPGFCCPIHLKCKLVYCVDPRTGKKRSSVVVC